MFTSRVTLKAVDQLENLTYHNYTLYKWMLANVPANINQLGIQMAWRAFERARREVPAYSHFLSQQGFTGSRPGSLVERFSDLSETDKNKYRGGA